MESQLTRVAVLGLADVRPETLAARVAADTDLIERLDGLEQASLSTKDRITHAMLRRELVERIEAHSFDAWQVPWTSDSGFHTAVASMPSEMPLEGAADYEAYLARLADVPRYFDQQIANLRAGLQQGLTLPRVTLAGYESTMSTHLVDSIDDSVFFAPFESFPPSVPEDLHGQLTQRGREAITEQVIPAYRKLLSFFQTEYVPGARTSLGASSLPDGAAYYAHLVRHFTTIETTAREVHDRGLAEVARIRADMEETIEASGFNGDFAEFLEFLRTDPRFYAETGEELLQIASRLAKRADAALPRFFYKLPRLPYGVAPVPEHLAPKYTAGRYKGAAPGSGEPGYYWVNTYALESRPLYALPALTLHEAVPGHHMQISLASEVEDVPEFRKHVYISAFGEGWALYTEYLGREMGLYDTPYDEFGRLTYEMWRAVRLVVDTGIHAFGWERQQSIDYLAGNTALSLHECTTEVDRYISWPGQALSYKTGELTIRRLRSDAEAALGPEFDLRAFHDAVLESGALPLTILEDVVRQRLGF